MSQPTTQPTTHTATHTVSGMTCGHCASTVTTQLQRLDGVTDIAVDIDAGTVTVSSDEPLDREDVRTVIEDAGYQLG